MVETNWQGAKRVLCLISKNFSSTQVKESVVRLQGLIERAGTGSSMIPNQEARALAGLMRQEIFGILEVRGEARLLSRKTLKNLGRKNSLRFILQKFCGMQKK